MAKDPAFLFYYQDFLVGTEFMSNAEVGCYIRILSHMADKGRLKEGTIKRICRDDEFTDELRRKFQVDQTGSFFNERLEEEVEKRKRYSVSRSKNRSNKKNIRKTYDSHMENENENENRNENKKRKEEFELIWAKYPNKAGKKKAMERFKRSVRTSADYAAIGEALEIYKRHLGANPWKQPQDGKTWFNSWRDWLEFEEPERVLTPEDKDDEILRRLGAK